jgi:antitoxin ParD1/3/4
MNISLTPELEQFIQNQVESGNYTSPEEVIIAGIRLLEERERIYKKRFEELRREITLGVEASERGEIVDSKTVFSQLQQKKGWMPGFFEEVIGGWVGEPLVREPQGEYEAREQMF